jgi:hypothetical protein
MSTSSEVFTIWPPKKPAVAEQQQQKKKSYVTNYVVGQGKTLDDVSLPRIATGGIVPWPFGRDIIANPDIIWYGNLKPLNKSTTSQETTTDESGNQTITTTVTTTVDAYTVDVQFCLGLGPGVRLRSIFVDNVITWTGTQGPARATFTVADSDTITDVIFAGGNFDQAIDPYLDGLIDQDLSAYRGFAYVILKSLDTTKLSNISFEVDRYPDPLSLGAHNKIGDDLNPISAMVDIITSTWGGAGYDISIIGTTFAAAAETLFTENNGCSMINRQTVSANDLNSIILDQINGTLYENHQTGTLEISLARKGLDRTSLVRIFDKDIISIDNMDKSSWQTIPTTLKAGYVDRSLRYRDVPLIARNLAASDKIRKSIVTLDFPAVRNGTLAAKLLGDAGANVASPVQQIQITVKRKASSLNPGDIFLLTCSKYKYYSVPATVVKRRLQPIDDNTVTLVANVQLYPNNNVIFAAPEDSFFVPIDSNPHPPTAVNIYSAPWFLRQSSGTALNTPPDNWLGTVQAYPQDVPIIFGTAFNAAQVNIAGYYDFNGVDTHFWAGQAQFSPAQDFLYPIVGKLNGAISKYDNWDGSQITINIKQLGPQVNEFNTILGAYSLGLFVTALIWIDDELFVFDHGRDTGSTSITIDTSLRTLVLTGCRRAYGDTVAQDHANNANVYVHSYYPSLLVSKLGFDIASIPAFKFVGAAMPKKIYTLSSLDTALAYSAWTANDRAARPLRPHDTKIAGSRGSGTPTNLTRGGSAAITWKVRSRVRQTVNLNPPFQTDANQTGEVHSGNHIVYRVMIIDSAAVSWDCGTTSSGSDVDNKTITVPAGAAAGNGWLYVQAEFDAGAGTKVSKYQDRLPVNLV